MSYRPLPAQLSSRAKRGICFFFALFFAHSSFVAAQDQPPRPKISGIAQVYFYSTNTAAARDFYSKALNSKTSCIFCDEAAKSQSAVETRKSQLVTPVNRDQEVMILNAPNPTPSNRLAGVTFYTDDPAAMQRFLSAKKIPYTTPQEGKGLPITVTDPEGNRIGFIAHHHNSDNLGASDSKLHIIHAGFIVHDRAATEHFYKDILGFRPYWHGGMKDDQTDWVSTQVPDGTDWLEFMVNVDANPDQRLRGIMNHIAIGVTNIHAAQKQLTANGVKLTEEPEIGRDGKWQLNVYDPDLTRVEFMEFKPVQKPCCSEFTGPHPQP